MPKLVATKDMRYAAVNLAAGEEFDATDQDARILKAIGKASDAAVGAAPQAAVEASPAVPAMTDNLFKQDTAPAEQKAPRRTYRRRDMVAED